MMKYTKIWVKITDLRLLVVKFIAFYVDDSASLLINRKMMSIGVHLIKFKALEVAKIISQTKLAWWVALISLIKIQLIGIKLS